MVTFFLLFLVVGCFAANPTCPVGFSVLNDNTCVKFFQTPLFYRDAQNYCKQFTGGHLVSLKNAIDNRQLFNLAQGYTRPIWLGLTCQISTYGACAWDDQSGYTSYYNAFANGNPNVDIGSNIYMLTTGNSAGNWISADGTVSQCAFFCEVPTNGAPKFCQNERNGYCYTLSLDLRDEAKSRSVCQQDCGDLASIHSQDENEHVYSLFPYTTGRYQFRIGARAAGNSKYWVDGSPFNYSNFGFFDSDAGLCSSLNLYYDVVDSRQWTSIPCNQELPFACKRAKNATSCGPRPTGNPIVPTNTVTYGPPPVPTVMLNNPEMCYHTHFYSGSGTIYSPYYPNNYRPLYSTDCKYIITVPPGTLAQIQFTPDTYTKKSEMYLYSEVEDGDQIGNFTGYPPAYPFNSTTNVIKIVFKIFTDHDGPDVKWAANFGNNETLGKL